MIIDQEIAGKKESSVEDSIAAESSSFQKKLQEKDDKIKNLQNIIRCYEEKLRLSKVKKFSYSSEQAEFIQMDFFDYQDEEISKEEADGEESDTSTDEGKKQNPWVEKLILASSLGKSFFTILAIRKNAAHIAKVSCIKLAKMFQRK